MTDITTGITTGQPASEASGPGSPSATRRRPVMFVVAAVAAVALVVLLSGCTKEDQLASLAIVNRDRAAYGVRTLIRDTSIQSSVQAHAQNMARAGRLYHSTLRTGTGVCAMAENVGVAGSVTQVERLFMQSSPHRANILNGRYDRGAVGVARVNGRVWVVQRFTDRC